MADFDSGEGLFSPSCLPRWSRFSRAAILILFFFTIRPTDAGAAEADDFGRWTGLWCSGHDEIGVNAQPELGQRANDQSRTLYIYVSLYLGTANSYTVEGPVTPMGDTLELTDGDCRVRAEIHGILMVVTDNRRCDKISAAFQRREFKRVSEYRHAKQHCSETE